MKAILVLDEMPVNCSECDLIDNVTGSCLVGVVDGYDYKAIRKGCPLRPLPQYQCEDRVYGYGAEYENGFDDCIDEILGEENK